MWIEVGHILYGQEWKSVIKEKNGKETAILPF